MTAVSEALNLGVKMGMNPKTLADIVNTCVVDPCLLCAARRSGRAESTVQRRMSALPSSVWSLLSDLVTSCCVLQVVGSLLEL